MTIDAGLSLSEAMRAVEHNHPGWHLYLDTKADVCAVTTQNPSNRGGGCTLDARTPEAMDREIAIQERTWGLPAKCWSDPLAPAERQELADRLTEACKRFYDTGADPARVLQNLSTLGFGHALMNCSSEMDDLHIDVTGLPVERDTTGRPVERAA